MGNNQKGIVRNAFYKRNERGEELFGGEHREPIWKCLNIRKMKKEK